MKQKIKKLILSPSKKEGVYIGTKKDGKEYSVRRDRHRYFFPDEWNSFINTIKNKKHKFFFLTLLHTGARIMEALNIKHEDIDMERQTITLKVVKQRKAKKNFAGTGKSRTFFISSNFLSEYKSFIRNNKINSKEYIFLKNEKLPKNYDALNNDEKRQYYFSAIVSYSKMLKTKLKLAGIPDWFNFSPHNIRKTYGMWMRTYNKELAELCYRMGHDMDTYIAHYGSSLIFSDEERRKINKIMGNVK